MREGSLKSPKHPAFHRGGAGAVSAFLSERDASERSRCEGGRVGDWIAWSEPNLALGVILGGIGFLHISMIRDKKSEHY